MLLRLTSRSVLDPEADARNVDVVLAVVTAGDLDALDGRCGLESVLVRAVDEHGGKRLRQIHLDERVDRGMLCDRRLGRVQHDVCPGVKHDSDEGHYCHLPSVRYGNPGGFIHAEHRIIVYFILFLYYLQTVYAAYLLL